MHSPSSGRKVISTGQATCGRSSSVTVTVDSHVPKLAVLKGFVNVKVTVVFPVLYVLSPGASEVNLKGQRPSAVPPFKSVKGPTAKSVQSGAVVLDPPHQRASIRYEGFSAKGLSTSKATPVPDSTSAVPNVPAWYSRIKPEQPVLRVNGAPPMPLPPLSDGTSSGSFWQRTTASKQKRKRPTFILTSEQTNDPH